ncbi:hypothetical protein SCP_0310230 [Sparassis crispa]|uniref:Uncharacterized protein n=1 Tax=Sparassis crispa TaxID=139825 RepID=A0A401GGI1_9APHY|nr:hypothetical protein SCP_0310230 [Sparassis crispa]GBE81296.1 hypothetical protein SCP_0310230 [Sparassis crispa]
MSTPFATPGMSGIRESRHESSSRSILRKLGRAPIYNPYDKFTQPEFDAWIGDITSALRSALGKEEPQSGPTKQREHADRESSSQDEREYVVEDSFAELRARREAKGKERAQDVGSEEEPIVLSDSEEEQGNADQLDENWGPVFNAEGYQAEYDEGEEPDSDAENEHRSISAEIIELSSDEEEIAKDAGSEEEDSGSEKEMAEVEDDVGSEEEDAGSEEEAERGDFAEDDAVDERAYSSLLGVHHDEEVEDEVPLIDDESEDEQVGEEDELFPPEENSHQPADLSDPWVGPSTYAEDFYSGGDVPSIALEHGDPHNLPTEENIELLEEDVGSDGSEEEGSDTNSEDERSKSVEVIDVDEPDELDKEIEHNAPQHPVDLPDPWSGPRTFAEDFYSGGELRESNLRARRLSPSHLTPMLSRKGSPAAVGAPQASPSTIQESYEDAHKQRRTSPLFADTEAYPALEDVHDTVPDAVGPFNVDEMFDDLYADLEKAVQGPDTHWDESVVSAGTSLGQGTHEHDAVVDWNAPIAPESADTKSALDHAFRKHEVLEVDDDEADHTAPLQKSQYVTNATNVEQHNREHQVPTENLVEFTATPAQESESFPRIISTTPAVVRPEPVKDEEEPVEMSLHDSVAPSVDTWNIPAGTGSAVHPPPDLAAGADDHDKVSAAEIQPAEGSFPKQSSPELVPEAEEGSEFTSGSRFGKDSVPGYSDTSVEHAAAPLSEEFAGIYEDDEPIIAVVTEAESDDDQHSELEEFDAETVIVVDESGAAEVEYTVEEPITDGRRTEEPEDVELGSVDVIVEDARAYETEETPPLHTPLHEQDIAASVDPGPQEGSVTGLTGKDKVVPEVVAQSLDSGENFDFAQLQYPIQDTDEPDTLDALQAQHDRSSEQHLDFGVPMPIYADPSVPDPASPRADSDALSGNGSQSGGTPAERALSIGLPVGSGLTSRGDTPAGLFTPLIADDSLPASPRTRNVELRDPERAFGRATAGFEVSTKSATLQAVRTTLFGPPSLSGQPIPADVGTSTKVSAHERRNTTEDHDIVEGNVIAYDRISAVDATASVSAVPEGPDGFDKAASPPSADDQNVEDVPSLASMIDSKNLGAPAGVELAPTPEVLRHSSPQEGTHDTDAEGEVDPDYEGRHEDTLPGPSSPHVIHYIPAAAKDADPFVLASSSSPSAPAMNGDSSAGVDVKCQEASHDLTTQRQSYTDRANGARAKTTPAEGTESPTAQSNDLSQKDETANASSTANPRQLRLLKRKRKSPVEASTRTTRSMARNISDGEPPPAQPSEGKGKQKAVENDHEDGSSPTCESVSGESKTNDDSKALAASSHTNSRASSIASTVPSNDWTNPPTSPATVRNANPAGFHQQYSLPFIHAHGVMRHHHGRPALHVQLPLPPQAVQPSNSISLSISPVDQGPTTETNFVEQLSPSQRVAPRPETGSPVTRSNCRFHKISLPREENGPRIYFAVPGCSLGDRDLMEQEHIEDHGPATHDANTRLVADIESVDFSPYLLGILRQLVGVDLLREQEVFYLPQQGERYKFKHKRKSRVAKMRLSQGGPLEHAVSQSPRLSMTPRLSAMRPPPSRAGSISTSGGSARRGSRPTTSSISESGLSDADDGDLPATKRQRGSSNSVEVEVETADSTAKASIVVSRRLVPRRGKKLGADAAAYKPEEDHPESSEVEAENRRTKRRKGGKKGVKRTRAEDPPDEQATIQPKKRKVRASSSEKTEDQR